MALETVLAHASNSTAGVHIDILISHDLNRNIQILPSASCVHMFGLQKTESHPANVVIVMLVLRECTAEKSRPLEEKIQITL